jgi:DNA-binding transcriptional LysR family regulator
MKAMQWDDRIGRRLRLKDLHTLQTVAESGSMAKASERLALSQPAISKAISNMERTLGAPLLDRSSRGVELTESGRLLVERGRVIFDEVMQGVRDIEHLSDPTRGEVRIGTSESASVYVAEIICRLTRKYPRIAYHITVSDTDTLARELRERALDVVLTRWIPPLVADDLAGEVLYKAPLAVMASKDHPLVHRKRLNLVDLMGEQWTLSPPDSVLGRMLAEVFRRRKLALPSAVVSTISIYMQLNLLASGPFLSVLPMTLLRHRSNSTWLRALSVDLTDSAGPIALVTVRNRRSGGTVKLFQEVSRTVCKEFVKLR